MFFIYNNGRSVFNLNHIARIFVETKELQNIGKHKYDIYTVVMSNGITYVIQREEYLRLMNYIIGNGNSNLPFTEQLEGK